MDDKTKKKLEQVKHMQALERNSRMLLSKTLNTKAHKPRKGKNRPWEKDEE